MDKPTAETVRQILDFNHETGILTWKEPRRGMLVGANAGKRVLGYLQTQIDGKAYYNHRLIWLYVTGTWPVCLIDHINGNRADNRFCNLREATHAENMRNRGKQKNNSTGFTGVRFHKVNNRWHAQIKHGGKYHNLGCFSTPEDAASAYESAARKHHGEFYRQKV